MRRYPGTLLAVAAATAALGYFGVRVVNWLIWEGYTPLQQDAAPAAALLWFVLMMLLSFVFSVGAIAASGITSGCSKRALVWAVPAILLSVLTLMSLGFLLLSTRM